MAIDATDGAHLAAASLGHRVTASDLSSSMLDELRAHAADRGLTVDARLGDAVAPDFPPREELPFMHLDGPEPILEMLSAVGFVDEDAEPRPELALGDGGAYFITARRA